MNISNLFPEHPVWTGMWVLELILEVFTNTETITTMVFYWEPTLLVDWSIYSQEHRLMCHSTGNHRSISQIVITIIGIAVLRLAYVILSDKQKEFQVLKTALE